jgi:hypothetical protein
MTELDNKLKLGLIGDKPYQRFIGYITKGTGISYEWDTCYDLYNDFVKKENAFVISSTAILPDSKHPWADYMEILLYRILDILIITENIDHMLQVLRDKEVSLRTQYDIDKKKFIQLKTMLIGEKPYQNIINSNITYSWEPCNMYRKLCSNEDAFIIPSDIIIDPNSTHPWADYMELLLFPLIRALGISELLSNVQFNQILIDLRKKETSLRAQHDVNHAHTTMDDEIKHTIMDDEIKSEREIYIASIKKQICTLRSKTKDVLEPMSNAFLGNWKHLFEQELSSIESDTPKIVKMINDLEMVDDLNLKIIEAKNNLDALMEKQNKVKDDLKIIDTLKQSQKQHFDMAQTLIDMGMYCNQN